MKYFWKILSILPILSFSQTVSNPYQFYEIPGGLFDKDSIRSIYIDIIDPNYHSVLVNSFFIDAASYDSII